MKHVAKLMAPISVSLALLAGLTLAAQNQAAQQQQAPPANSAQQQTSPAPAPATQAAPAAEPASPPIPPCPTPAPALTTRKWKGNGTPNSERAEYDAYVKATQATDRAQQAQDFAAFVQQFPNSDYLMPALEGEMGAQAQSNNNAGAVDTALEILKSPKADADAQADAYTVLAYLLPAEIGKLTGNDPKIETMLGQLDWAAQCGAKELAGATPPAGQSAEQFDQKKAQSAYIFNRAEGFVALQRKQYSTAVADLTSAIQFNNKDVSAYYWLGIAALSQKPNPDFSAGIFYIARANSLSPQTAVISQYLNNVYNGYHGSMDGLDQVKQAAAASPTPPAGFHIQSAAEIAEAANEAAIAAAKAAREKQMQVLYPPDTFRGMKQRLMNPDTASGEWKQIKGQGYQFEGIVISAEPRNVQVAVDPFDIQDQKADVHLILTTPHRDLQPGQKVILEGIATDLQTSPDFMLTLTKGTIKPAS